MDNGSQGEHSRRGFLAGLAAAALAPRPSWADVGAPDYLAAARARDGTFVLCGLTETGDLTFSQNLPTRGHAAAAHPLRPEAVAFARRPGTFALVMDCRGTGQVVAELGAPNGRHFYGHGAFSSDGTLLYTSESDYEAAQGRVGIWDAAGGYRRVGEIPTYGTGPHELLRLPGQETLVVANGGIETHPSTGRTKLNLDVMQPSLVYLSPAGDLLDRVVLAEAWHQNSIRHLAARADGMVAGAFQWQGDLARTPPLLMLHRRDMTPKLLHSEAAAHQQMQGYAGSVAFSGDGARVAITSPRGGRVEVYATQDGAHTGTVALEDACGIAPASHAGFCVTTGTGILGRLGVTGFQQHVQQGVQWDNHLVALRPTGS
ncbi:MAG: DUF1513 domain-containing protein [Pseudomonadota bacterium]